MTMEAEYNNRAKVPDHPAIMAGWQRDAAAFRAAHPHKELDCAYGPTPRQALDLFWPAVERDAPIAMFIHGGYWQALDRTWFSHMAAGLVAHGIAVAVISYDLCPGVTLATLIDQVRAAAVWLYRRARRPIFAFGHSAGGHLTAMLMATNWPPDLPRNLVSVGLSISGLFDLEPLIDTSINAGLKLDRLTAHALSPLRLPPPPGRLHAVVGGEEGAEYERQSRAIATAWGGTWERIPGENHFTILDQFSAPDSRLSKLAIVLADAARRSF
jgi:arylformamidase